jgi:hypothetical protein
MSKNLQNCIEILKHISEIKNPKKRKEALIIFSNNDCLYSALNEIAKNQIFNKIPLSKKNNKLLKDFTPQIKKLACKTKNKQLQKRRIIQSGGFLPILIPAVASILTTLASDLITKN